MWNDPGCPHITIHDFEITLASISAHSHYFHWLSLGKIMPLLLAFKLSIHITQDLRLLGKMLIQLTSLISLRKHANNEKPR